MRKQINRLILTSSVLLAICIVAAGCSTVSLQSNSDPAAIHRVNRLFIIIQEGDAKNRALADYLAADFRNCFSNRPTFFEVAITTPLDLDERDYERRINAFDADSVLTIGMRSVVADPYGGYPTINYDASLFERLTKKRIWRADIVNSGSPEVMEQRMQKMATAIVSQLEHDGFL
jgi:hypothetical protein